MATVHSAWKDGISDLSLSNPLPNGVNVNMAFISRLISGAHWRLAVFRDRFIGSCKRGVLARCGPFACNVCGRRTWKYAPLPAQYLELNKKHGRDLSLLHGETCNIGSYQCPACEAPDRVRLYALYLSAWFKDQPPGSEKVFVDFAPSRPLYGVNTFELNFNESLYNQNLISTGFKF